MLKSSVLEQSISHAQVLATSPVDILAQIPISVIPITAGQLYIKTSDEHMV